MQHQELPSKPVLNYKTAAVELSVSVNTISFDMRRIYDKLHAHTKSEAVAKTLRNQIVV